MLLSRLTSPPREIVAVLMSVDPIGRSRATSAEIMIDG